MHCFCLENYQLAQPKLSSSRSILDAEAFPKEVKCFLYVKASASFQSLELYI